MARARPSAPGMNEANERFKSHLLDECGAAEHTIRAYAADLADRGLPVPENLDAFLASGSFQPAIHNDPELQAMFEEVKAGF